MATTPTQIRIDSTVKEEATALFSELGMDMSNAVNISFASVSSGAVYPSL